jgi:hypothetical protein
MSPPLIFDYFPDRVYPDEFQQASSLPTDETTGSGYPDLTQDLAYSYGETDTRDIAKSEMGLNVPFMASENSDENDLSEMAYDQQRPTFTFPQSLSGENLPLDQYTSYPGEQSLVPWECRTSSKVAHSPEPFTRFGLDFGYDDLPHLVVAALLILRKVFVTVHQD